jgi:hypothetical protein
MLRVCSRERKAAHFSLAADDLSGLAVSPLCSREAPQQGDYTLLGLLRAVVGYGRLMRNPRADHVQLFRCYRELSMCGAINVR